MAMRTRSESTTNVAAPGFRLAVARERRAGPPSPARRDSLGLPRPVDDEWQRVQERIEGIVRRHDDDGDREPRRHERARTHCARAGTNEGESR